ncbi:MAG: beta-mannosidase [Paramuribaculum sp.]|nr:beta-mannosidase [Paramuribaculum sp.]
MNRKYLLLMALPLMLGCSSKKAENTADLSPKEALRSRLDSLQSRGLIAFGHADDTAYGHSWAWDEGKSDVKSVTGDYPAVINWDLGGIEKGDAENLDGVPFEHMRKEIIAQASRGGINVLSWHTVNPVNGGDSWQCSDTTIVSRLLNDSTVQAEFDTQMTRVAVFLNSLTDASGEKIAVVFRPWHEHTGNWFWWGAAQSTPEDYKALWKKTREIADREGVDNVLWAYSPDRVKNYDQYMERYPGDELVDIMGADVYCYTGGNSIEVFVNAVDSTLGAATKAAQEHGKLVAFTETGLEGIPSDDWWTQVLLPTIGKYPVSYVVVWRNAHDKPDHYFAPWEGQQSEQDFKKFHASPKTVFAKEMNEIR